MVYVCVCLFVFSSWQTCCLGLVCLQCFPPARPWTSTATTANVSAAPGCVTETMTARTTPTNRTVVSILPLSCQHKTHKWWQPHWYAPSHTHTLTHTQKHSRPALSGSGGWVIKVDRCLRQPCAMRCLFCVWWSCLAVTRTHQTHTH